MLDAFPDNREDATAPWKGVAAATVAAAEEERFKAALKTEPGGGMAIDKRINAKVFNGLLKK